MPRTAQCSATELAGFKNAGTCADESAGQVDYLRCSDLTADESLALVNPKYRMELQQHTTLDAITCIAVDNNPVEGDFYKDPVPGSATSLDSGVFDRSDVQASSSSLVLSQVVATSTSTAFSVGETIPAAVASGSTLASLEGNQLRFMGAFSGISSCSIASQVRFRQAASQGASAFVAPAAPAPGSSAAQCRFSGPITAETCAALNPALWADTIRIGTAPNAVASNPASYLAPTVGSVDALDVATGQRTQSTDAVAAAGSVYNATTAECQNALLGLELTLRYSSSGTITAAAVALVIATITPATPATVVTLPVRSTVLFAPDASALAGMPVSAAAGNQIARSLSGSPGYKVGAPVLAGNQAADDAGIQQDLTGLLLYGSSASGSCSSGSSAPLLLVQASLDLSSTCAMSMTDAQLQSRCASATAPDSLSLNATHVGTFGNSDPLKPAEWLQLTLPAASPQAAQYDADSRTCNNAIVGMHVQLMTAFVGKQGNGQRKIVAGRVRYITGSWRHTTAASSAQDYSVQTLVTWTHLPDEELEELLPPVPRVIPAVPSDFFFPFHIASTTDWVVSGASSVAVQPVVLLSAAAATLLYGCWF